MLIGWATGHNFITSMARKNYIQFIIQWRWCSGWLKITENRVFINQLAEKPFNAMSQYQWRMNCVIPEIIFDSFYSSIVSLSHIKKYLWVLCVIYILYGTWRIFTLLWRDIHIIIKTIWTFIDKIILSSIFSTSFSFRAINNFYTTLVNGDWYKEMTDRKY